MPNIQCLPNIVVYGLCIEWIVNFKFKKIKRIIYGSPSAQTKHQEKNPT